jgi:hypothetical protein
MVERIVSPGCIVTCCNCSDVDWELGKFQVWYDTEEFFQAWDHMILAATALTRSFLFRYYSQIAVFL